ncbi:hypothetical protein [Paenibacillus andongensis]|uniref:hypothetical protein n=1 Tax=Paenibacillus andongensis TaxID=2975482 RepID=UPI0021BAEA4E|nr:hypothetical protein [Paenibacillus andongensis]
MPANQLQSYNIKFINIIFGRTTNINRYNDLNSVLANHDFETGDLTGWTVVSGTAFSSASVTSLTNWGWGGPFKQNKEYALTFKVFFEG